MRHGQWMVVVGRLPAPAYSQTSSYKRDQCFRQSHRLPIPTPHPHILNFPVHTPSFKSSTEMTGIVLQEGQSDLPSRDSTASYWHKEPRLIGHHTTEKLPSEVDTVVVGSGITGAFAAREVVAGGRGVLLLESREVCWGATGRVRWDFLFGSI